MGLVVVSDFDLHTGDTIGVGHMSVAGGFLLPPAPHHIYKGFDTQKRCDSPANQHPHSQVRHSTSPNRLYLSHYLLVQCFVANSRPEVAAETYEGRIDNDSCRPLQDSDQYIDNGRMVEV